MTRLCPNFRRTLQSHHLFCSLVFDVFLKCGLSLKPSFHFLTALMQIICMTQKMSHLGGKSTWLQDSFASLEWSFSPPSTQGPECINDKDNYFSTVLGGREFYNGFIVEFFWGGPLLQHMEVPRLGVKSQL